MSFFLFALQMRYLKRIFHDKYYNLSLKQLACSCSCSATPPPSPSQKKKIPRGVNCHKTAYQILM